jgi:hypothetical protein
MTLLDVSFGIFAFMPQGWLFMAFLILIECFTMTGILLPKAFDKRIFLVTTLTNVISGAVGIFISMTLNGGWWLVVWLPWVSKHEIDLSIKGELQRLIIYYAAAFVLTLVLEAIINIPLLSQQYPTRKILKATLIANMLSYAAGSLILYSISFN